MLLELLQLSCLLMTPLLLLLFGNHLEKLRKEEKEDSLGLSWVTWLSPERLRCSMEKSEGRGEMEERKEGGKVMDMEGVVLL